MNMVYAFFDTFAIVDATTKGGPGKGTAILVYRVLRRLQKAWTWAALPHSRWC